MLTPSHRRDRGVQVEALPDEICHQPPRLRRVRNRTSRTPGQRRFEHVVHRLLGKSCRHCIAGRVPLHTHRFEGPADPAWTASPDDHLGSRKRACGAGVVERALALEAGERGVDRVGIAAAAAQPVAQLARRQLPPAERRERIGVRVWRRPLAHGTSVASARLR